MARAGAPPRRRRRLISVVMAAVIPAAVPVTVLMAYLGSDARAARLTTEPSTSPSSSLTLFPIALTTR